MNDDGYAPFAEIVRRFQDEDGATLMQARLRSALLLAVGTAEDAGEDVSDLTMREWSERMELIFVQEGFNPDGTDRP